ncbi:hypothetical protein D910_06599 [Dendroctonus ponderosae]|uniref:Uncharacterized protein n=1 Tax=Dendroctonus ponderosae TaxID=77166 RepID=U4UH48_DENPD|nr:hypothetical protein D910_06599 [Dendroctonus ponderosae]
MSFRPCCVPSSAMIFVLNGVHFLEDSYVFFKDYYIHSKDTLSRESRSNHTASAPELRTPKKIKDDILDSPFTAVTSTNSARATQFRG